MELLDTGPLVTFRMPRVVSRPESMTPASAASATRPQKPHRKDCLMTTATLARPASTPDLAAIKQRQQAT
jgi:hypothetical protein